MSISVAKAEPDISMLALEATLTAMKGTGWTIESLRAIYNAIVALPPGLTAADVWTFAARTLTNLSDIRAGYIDNINNVQLLNVPDLSTLSALRIGYLDNINNAQLLNISAAILGRIDTAISSRMVKLGAGSGLAKAQAAVVGSGYIIGAFFAVDNVVNAKDYHTISLSVDGAAAVIILNGWAPTAASTDAFGNGNIGLLIRYTTGFTPAEIWVRTAPTDWGVLYIPD